MRSARRGYANRGASKRPTRAKDKHHSGLPLNAPVTLAPGALPAAAATSAAVTSESAAGFMAFGFGSGMLLAPPEEGAPGRFRLRGIKAVLALEVTGGGMGGAGASALALDFRGLPSVSESESSCPRSGSGCPTTSAPPGPVTCTASSLPAPLPACTSNSTVSPSNRERKPVLFTDRWCTKISPRPSARVMKPQPALAFHLTTVPFSRRAAAACSLS
mmetsp:Transcript_15641/g.51082  ORF Transcript_15641/g.51082 Transcript_15641/m.51082 type:complete len:217 (+) Transcript_15641:260-910(+)|eukprot:scaffold3930_cov116-Isochrysis_galbana.AAC.5